MINRKVKADSIEVWKAEIIEKEHIKELLDRIRAEIESLNPVDYGSMFSYESHNGAKDMQRDILRILDNVGNAESEDKQ